jgi:uncharacterized protein DUF4383
MESSAISQRGVAGFSRGRDGERSFVQAGVLVVSAVLMAWSIWGFIANPSFATGADATSTRVLGVDFNAWHAISGFLLFGPGLYLARRRDWALLFSLAAVASLYATGVWALLSDRPAGLFPFDHAHADAILHFGSGTAYLLVALIELRRSGV